MEAGAGGSASRMLANKGKKEVEHQEPRAVLEEDDNSKKKKKKKASTALRCCQADNCPADLMEAKAYHRRHKVCDHHSKAPDVLVAALHQRFCQQCSRFHELWEFDDAKRSCRRRLAGHNERRRKSAAAESQRREVRAGQAED